MFYFKIDVKLFFISVFNFSFKFVRFGCLIKYGKIIKIVFIERMEFNNIER